MKLNSLRDLYVEQLQDLYSAETQIVEALPLMAKAASNPQLKSGFEEHLAQTKQHVQRLETIFQQLGTSPKGQKCKGMEGLLKEGEEVLEEEGAQEVKDAAMIGAAQKVEHYEMALYGTLRTYARRIGRPDDEALLQQTLNEEEEADRVLTDVAESHVNEQAER